MNYQAQQYIAQGVIQHLDGNTELFQVKIKMAMEIIYRDAHLFVSVDEILKSKGRKIA